MGKKFFAVLMTIDTTLVASGIGFAVYSIITGSSFTIMGNSIPGFIFAAVAVFLGIRYMKALFRLNRAIAGSGMKFSWNNFKLSRKCNNPMKG